MRPHVMSYQPAVFEASGDDQIIIHAITVKHDFAHGPLVCAFHLSDSLTCVDVPNGHRALTVARNDQAIDPFKLNNSIFMAIEEALSTFEGIEIPHQETGIIGRRYADVV